MSLHIVLGLPDSKPNSEPTVIYAGRRASLARELMAVSACPRFLLFVNPIGIPKNNARAHHNLAASVKPAASRSRARS